MMYVQGKIKVASGFRIAPYEGICDFVVREQVLEVGGAE